MHISTLLFLGIVVFVTEMVCVTVGFSVINVSSKMPFLSNNKNVLYHEKFSSRMALKKPIFFNLNKAKRINKFSLLATSHHDILSGINILYPPDQLSGRNAASRTDGYWAFISKGENPPVTLTYGEFDFLFFARLMDKALMHRTTKQENDIIILEDITFTDIGSGTGRLVIGAAALHPSLKLCKGLELLPRIHEMAESVLDRCTIDDRFQMPSFLSSNGIEKQIPLAPITFTRGSFEDPYEYIGDSDVIFVFSTCFTPEMMKSLSDAIGRQCKEGTIVITTEYKLHASGIIDPTINDPNLPYGQYTIDEVESVDGDCWLVGGKSTAHIQRVTKSLWNSSCPRQKPKELSTSDVLLVPPQEELTFEQYVHSQRGWS